MRGETRLRWRMKRRIIRMRETKVTKAVVGLRRRKGPVMTVEQRRESNKSRRQTASEHSLAVRVRVGSLLSGGTIQ